MNIWGSRSVSLCGAGPGDGPVAGCGGVDVDEAVKVDGDALGKHNAEEGKVAEVKIGVGLIVVEEWAAATSEGASP